MVKISVIRDQVLASESSTRVWLRALADAALKREDAFLVEYRGPPPESGLLARLNPADQTFYWDQSLTSEQYLDIRQIVTERSLPVVELWATGLTEDEVAFRVRHELEHLMQLSGARVLGDFHRSAEELVAAKSPSGLWYQLIPMERDANRAAARFVESEGWPRRAVGPTSVPKGGELVLAADDEARARGLDLTGRMVEFLRRASESD